MGEVNTELAAKKAGSSDGLAQRSWMLPNTPVNVNVKNLAKYAIESHSKRK